MAGADVVVSRTKTTVAKIADARGKATAAVLHRWIAMNSAASPAKAVARITKNVVRMATTRAADVRVNMDGAKAVQSGAAAVAAAAADAGAVVRAAMRRDILQAAVRAVARIPAGRRAVKRLAVVLRAVARLAVVPRAVARPVAVRQAVVPRAATHPAVKINRAIRTDSLPAVRVEAVTAAGLHAKYKSSARRGPGMFRGFFYLGRRMKASVRAKGVRRNR